MGRRLLWLFLQRQGIQVEVLPGRTPVRLLQLAERLVFKRGGVRVRTGPHPHGPRHAGASWGHKGAAAAFFLITEEISTSPGTVFFLQLKGLKIKTSSLSLLSVTLLRPVSPRSGTTDESICKSTAHTPKTTRRTYSLSSDLDFKMLPQHYKCCKKKSHFCLDWKSALTTYGPTPPDKNLRYCT